MKKEYYVVIIILVVVAGGAYFFFFSGSNDNGQTPNDDNNNKNDQQLTALSIYNEHQTQLQDLNKYKAYTFNILEDGSGDLYSRNTETWINKNKDKYFVLAQNSNQGVFMKYANFREEQRTYNMIQSLGLIYHENSQQEEFVDNNVRYTSLNNYYISRDEKFDASELSNLEVEYNTDYTRNNVTLDEYLTTNYTGTKYNDLYANFLVDQEGRIILSHIHVEDSGQKADITQEFDYGQENMTISRDMYAWIDDSISRSEAEQTLRDYLEVEYQDRSEVKDTVQPETSP